MGLLVARAHQDPGARLTVVGRPVVPTYTRALHRFVAEMGMADAVTFAGPLSDADLVQVFGSSDALVVTSAHEGFGVPVVEAMLAGLPVVANRAGALPEVVGEGGVLVDTARPLGIGVGGERGRGRPGNPRQPARRPPEPRWRPSTSGQPATGWPTWPSPSSPLDVGSPARWSAQGQSAVRRFSLVSGVG